MFQRPQFFPGEVAADRQVLQQPLVLQGDLLDPSASFKCTTMEACHRYHLWSVPSRKAKPF
jgi:hypothetical protein